MLPSFPFPSFPSVGFGGGCSQCGRCACGSGSDSAASLLAFPFVRPVTTMVPEASSSSSSGFSSTFQSNTLNGKTEQKEHRVKSEDGKITSDRRYAATLDQDDPLVTVSMDGGPQHKMKRDMFEQAVAKWRSASASDTPALPPPATKGRRTAKKGAKPPQASAAAGDAKKKRSARGAKAPPASRKRRRASA